MPEFGIVCKLEYRLPNFHWKTWN